LAWDLRPRCSFLVLKVYDPLLKTLNVCLFDFSLLGMTGIGRQPKFICRMGTSRKSLVPVIRTWYGVLGAEREDLALGLNLSSQPLVLAFLPALLVGQ
jgi:hypothetical protein